MKTNQTDNKPVRKKDRLKKRANQDYNRQKPDPFEPYPNEQPKQGDDLDKQKPYPNDPLQDEQHRQGDEPDENNKDQIFFKFYGPFCA